MVLETIPETAGRGRALGLHAAARRLRIPERTLRYQASRGRIPGAFKQGKLWKFWVSALEDAQQRRLQDTRWNATEVNHLA